jgi:sarcosine oxidase
MDEQQKTKAGRMQRDYEVIVLGLGGLGLEPANAAILLDDYVRSLAAESVPFELLDADEIMRRWPQFRLTPTVTS